MIHPAWSHKAVIYEMNVRQLTKAGTLRAAQKRLKGLHEMGIDAIWLMPIHPVGEEARKGTLGSYYSVRDYCAVSPDLGTLADLDAFVAEAHRLGMKVLLDWVANHTARDARWITEHPDWYEYEDGAPKIPCGWTDTAKLDYTNTAVWQGQVDAMRFWVEEHAIDGFRCDMAMLVPTEFWCYASCSLRRLKPDLFMLSEAEEVPLCCVGGFNAYYGWRQHHLMNDVAQQNLRVTALRDYLYHDGMPQSALRLSFTSNHDENSWNGTEFTRMGAAHEIMSLFTFVVPNGLPLLYTGQEIGYDHVFAFFDRDPIPVYRRNKFTKRYAQLIALHHDNPALWAGGEERNWVEIRNNAEDCLMILVRETEGNRVIAVMNFSPYTIQAEYNTGIYAGRYRDYFAEKEYTLPTEVSEVMGPWEYRVLVQNR
ncbi:MAG: alpha-amylase [Alistipes sp.]|nr:alpha-amylase [Alistipes sp.]